MYLSISLHLVVHVIYFAVFSVVKCKTMYKVGTITQVLNSLFQGCNLLVVLLIKSFITTNIKNDNSEVKLINQLAQLILVEFGNLVKVVYNGALR